MHAVTTAARRPLAAVAELDALDAAVAIAEGPAIAVVNLHGIAFTPDGMRYRPTTDAAEATRLMDKYVVRLVKRADSWIAVGANGRAEEGATAFIATCKVAAASAA